ncbi:unnamed protein product [Pleuronectes platessa]|uniref:Uncharacterized protein n=1 Tax=Pleuronectes platessa TaxID=8262 RepID=A0A9N7Z9V2_PLEPL|nr:unnamed protein product [Pleuronectes platessa]
MAGTQVQQRGGLGGGGRQGRVFVCKCARLREHENTERREGRRVRAQSPREAKSKKGSERRYPTPRLSATPAPVERILKRFGGSNPLLLPLNSPFGSLTNPPPPIPFSAEGSFKGLGESAGAAVPARPRGCAAQR